MPQPIDPYTEIGRATAAERIQQIADRTSLAAQNVVAKDEAETQAKKETQAHQAQQKNEEVDDEMRRRNPYMKRRKRKKESKDQSHTFYTANEQETVLDDPDAHDLDVLI